MIKLLSNDYLIDIMNIMNIIKDVILRMNQQGIDQWDEVYPDIETIRKDLQEKCAFGYFIGDELSGYISINEDMPPEYNSLIWKIEQEQSLIVHRLIVKVQQQGKGIAKEIMSFAEDYAKKIGYKAIRLDAFSKNPVSLKLYESNGYQKVGLVYFRKGLFYCFEKNL